MGAVCRRNWSSNPMMWLTFASVFFLWGFTVGSAASVSEREFANYKQARRKLDDIGGKSLFPLIKVAKHLILRHGSAYVSIRC